ncbi:hypothetical protein BTO04_09920 [Polaribacter sp. SA4-10]|uniref:hypothetical protein n=1 Tax=Polaribacter sp. SA4-10 TaxID=754397 RepID=UPI000B3D313F|nr:hypothetical protein [Polaribacter sp. SA4-10]ARV06983.1 hypothetical protein BTO04_09920 [Polaribacter sp. SA4-10]
MIKKIITVIILLLLIGWFVGNSDWHLNRNTHNVLPIGFLKKVTTNFYDDDRGRCWELLPHSKNIFHQPEEESKAIENPYSNVDLLPPFDTKNPNIKFLSELENGCSYEAILQPDGTYLTTGRKQGTYNYSHPSGFFGTFKHVILDVIPHFFNDDYK